MFLRVHSGTDLTTKASEVKHRVRVCHEYKRPVFRFVPCSRQHVQDIANAVPKSKTTNLPAFLKGDFTPGNLGQSCRVTSKIEFVVSSLSEFVATSEQRGHPAVHPAAAFGNSSWSVELVGFQASHFGHGKPKFCRIGSGQASIHIAYIVVRCLHNRCSPTSPDQVADSFTPIVSRVLVPANWNGRVRTHDPISC